MFVIISTKYKRTTAITRYTLQNWFQQFLISETAIRRCSWKKMFWKYAVNLQENAHAEV